MSIMRKPLIILSLLLTFGFISCQKNTVFREFKKFDNYTWGRFDKITFTIPIEDEGITADIALSIRHLDQYPYDNLPMNIILTTPTGEERIIEKSMVLKDEYGNFKGNVAGSYWDQEEVLWTRFIFNKSGNYTIELENLNPRPGIPALVDIGLIVRK